MFSGPKRPGRRMKSHGRNIQWSERPNRRMELSYRKGPRTGSEEKGMTVNVGVDLHKTQFTVSVDCGKGDEFAVYSTEDAGYADFLRRVKVWQKDGHAVRAGVESTGNTRYFKSRLETAGVEVVVINTLKFKVVNESVKKTDKHDAATIAEFLEKDMLPEAHLCSETSEQLRRLLKVRTNLVQGLR
jgi:transposase